MDIDPVSGEGPSGEESDEESDSDDDDDIPLA